MEQGFRVIGFAECLIVRKLCALFGYSTGSESIVLLDIEVRSGLSHDIAHQTLDTFPHRQQGFENFGQMIDRQDLVHIYDEDQDVS